MYVLAWETPTGMYAYGPFRHSAECQGWLDRRRPFLGDVSGHRLRGFFLSAPFQQADHGVSTESVGQIYHLGRDADDRTGQFVVALVVSESVTVGIGAFSDRDLAAEWFLDNRLRLGGASALVLPMLPADG